MVRNGHPAFFVSGQSHQYFIPMVNRTPLTLYLATTIQMLMARTDGKDDSPYLDKLDELHNLLTEEDIQFIDEMGKDWATHYWCKTCAAMHLNDFKCV